MPALTCDGRLRPVTLWYIVPAIGDSYSIVITPRAAAIARAEVRAPPATYADAADTVRLQALRNDRHCTHFVL